MVKENTHIRFNESDLIGNEIKVGQHCFGCTAGQGSSCSGALKN